METGPPPAWRRDNSIIRILVTVKAASHECVIRAGQS